jgi:alpha-tubulin suppressor-like RCC1 family protein
MKAHRTAAIFAALVASLTVCAGAQAAGGTAVGWGNNEIGLVGTGELTVNPIESPAAVRGVTEATQISSGNDHALALRANGTVMAWGFNDLGQLGDGTTENRLIPSPVPGLTDVVAVAVAGATSLALRANGTVMAWGDNGFGGLGNGTSSDPEACGTDSCSKVPVPVPGLSGVVAIAGGSSVLALLANGTVMAWGENGVGQSGDGGKREGCKCVDRPTLVPGVSGAVAISAGEENGSALLANGTVKAWGANSSGQLGNDPTLVGDCRCLGPVTVSALAGAKAIAFGAAHSLALLSNGVPQAWGQNDAGQLGNGTFSDTGCECVPVVAPVAGLAGVRGVAAGGFHNLALLTDGTVRSWGEDDAGQLGVPGSEESRNLPTPVNGVSGASAVFADQDNSFALIGPSQTLRISFAGAGTGAVGGSGILCTAADCESRYPQSQVEILRAEPSPGSGFAGFSGPCQGTGPCQVKMDGDQTVTATFGPPKGTRITRARIKSRSRRNFALFSFTAPGAITGFQCKLTRPKPARKGKRRPKARFVACPASKRYKRLRTGRYTLQVRALNILGADANPAKKRFTIKARKARKRQG